MIFYKLHALSNDFIFFEKKNMKKININSVCDRNTGIGADGVVFYEIIDDIMYIQLFNKDGSLAKNPGNAFFCAAKLWSVIHEDKLKGKILSDDIVFEYKKIDKGVNAYFEKIPERFVRDGYFEVKAGNMHKVFIREDISSEEMSEIARECKEYNINFIKKQEDSYVVKVYETGVGFTLGAASSALAVFSCIYEEYGCSEVKLIFEGGIVKAVFKDNVINLTCFPYFVFSGEYNIN